MRDLYIIEENLNNFYELKNNGNTTENIDQTVINLESERKKLLLAEEEQWQQKNRAIWIKSAYKNTKLFHHFASYSRNKKFIWEINDGTGVLHTGQQAIKVEAVKFFKYFFNDTGQNTIVNQINTVRMFPNIVREEDIRHLEKIVTKNEIFEILRGFAKDKSHGPDGWTVEFFLHFFELIGQDLLNMVEESTIRGEVIISINSTFLALTPKANNPTEFNDFRSIALCNLCYKIIAKVIVKRIRPILSRSLSKEQLGFLKRRQILDVIKSTQECLHSIKSKKIQAIILKLDLKKAYDCTVRI